MHKKSHSIGAAALLLAGVASAESHAAANDPSTFIVTASNAAANELLIYDTAGTLLKRIPTQGQGGVGGNAGGIEQDRDRLAAVNFGSGNVAVFTKDPGRADLKFEELVPALASPVSVAFGNDHLYILTTTHVESHLIDHGGVHPTADGAAGLVVGDGSAAQVGVVKGQLIISEKSNVIESVNLAADGAVSGKTKTVANIPANVNAPFGLATRGDDAYVTIAHANEISLVRYDDVLTVTGSGTQHAPCWVTIDGPFLFSANSPSQSVSRYVVYGKQIIQDDAVAATFVGDPTDINYHAGWVAVLDHTSAGSHLTVFSVDEDGNLNAPAVATLNGIVANGVAVVSAREHQGY